MKTLSVGEFKAHFSDVIEEVKKGAKIAVTYGKKKQVVGYFVPSTKQCLFGRLFREITP